jgi:hypothetical protein
VCVSYPIRSFGGGHVSFNPMRYGNKVANYNTEPGVTTIGQLPDHIAALLSVGKLSNSDVENLHKGAEWFIRMWEKSERRSKCVDGGCAPEPAPVPPASASASQDSTVTSTVTVRLTSLHSNKCLDVAGWGTTNGSNVHSWECHGGDNQKWRLLPNGTIQSVHSNKCLDVAGWGTANGTNVMLWDCHGGQNQQWRVLPNGALQSLHSNKCLDVGGASTANGANVHIWDCHGGANNMWARSPV